MHINKYQLAKGTWFETPYYMIRGAAEGNTVMITAGVHGNERANVVAAKKLLRLLELESLTIHNGTLIIVPVVNQNAYKRRIRGIPDLNRTFPLSIKKKARHPLSAALFQLALNFQPDWYIDLHEANGFSKLDRRVLGQTLIADHGCKAVPALKRVVNRINRSIAQKSKHFTIRLCSLPGSGRTAAKRLLKSKSITVETCWSLPISIRVHFQSKILQALLVEAGLLSDLTNTSTKLDVMKGLPPATYIVYQPWLPFF